MVDVGVRVCLMMILWGMQRKVVGRNRDVEEDEDEDVVRELM